MLSYDELDDLLNTEDGLTDWEVEFIESLNKQREEHRAFTDRQIAKLHQVWDERYGND